MNAGTALERLGGVASTRVLLRLTSRRQIRRALARRTITKVGRGRYALPTAEVARLAAAGLSGVVCLRSAAAHHGWGLKVQPELPEVAVNPRRHLTAERRAGVRVAWMTVAVDDVAAGVTTPLRTVLDCARHLPLDEALAIADSALRSGMVGRAELDAAQVRGAGAAAVRRVLAHADARAANPFESVLRAHCIEAGLQVVPQQAIDLDTGTVRPDLVSRTRWLVLEADSWAFHATRTAHQRDCARYNLLTLHGWRVLRFTWEQVIGCPPETSHPLPFVLSDAPGVNPAPPGHVLPDERWEGAVVGVRRGLAAYVVALGVLLALLGVGAGATVVGLTCGVVLAVAAARRADVDEVAHLGPADHVTLARATLACGAAALVAASFAGADVVGALVPLTVVALALDFVDGRVARRTGTASAYGGRLDGEADAFLILVLSVYVAGSVGAWVLAMGLVRYAYAVATWCVPWMRRELPPRYWRKVVAAFTGIALAVAASGAAPPVVTYAGLVVAWLLLAESFGWDVVWLWRRRPPQVNRTRRRGVLMDDTLERNR